MQTFSKQVAFVDAWNHFARHSFTVIGVFAVTVLMAVIMGIVVDSVDQNAVAVFVLNVFDFLLQIIVSMGAIYILLRIHDGVDTGLHDLLVPVSLLGHYLIASVLVFAIVAVGFALFIIPGIFFALAFSMAPYLVIDKGLGALAALKESYAITEGHRWNIFLFSMLLAVCNVIGALFFGIGLIITVPLSMLAMVYVYRFLETPESARTQTVAFTYKSKLLAVGIGLAGMIASGLIIGPMLFPSFFTNAAEVRTKDMINLELAIGLYNDAYDIYPLTLDVLVPDYLPVLPVDPESRIPYMYEVTSDGSDYILCARPTANIEDQLCTIGATRVGEDTNVIKNE